MAGLTIGKSGSANIPSRVEAAQSFLYFCNDSENPQANMMGDTPKCGRDLSKTEAATKAAALQVLIQYFNGEMDFGDKPPRDVPIDPEDPQSPVVEPTKV